MLPAALRRAAPRVRRRRRRARHHLCADRRGFHLGDCQQHNLHCGGLAARLAALAARADLGDGGVLHLFQGGQLRSQALDAHGAAAPLAMLLPRTPLTALLVPVACAHLCPIHTLHTPSTHPPHTLHTPSHILIPSSPPAAAAPLTPSHSLTHLLAPSSRCGGCPRPHLPPPPQSRPISRGSRRHLPRWCSPGVQHSAPTRLYCKASIQAPAATTDGTARP